MGYTIDIDTGGTLTDGFFVRDKKVETVKVPTTPHDLTKCFLDCIKAGAECFEVQVEDMLMETDVIRFSTTIGTNTLIERNGTKIGLLVSHREDTAAELLNDQDEFPLVYPEMIKTLKGAVDGDGNITEELDREEVLKASQELLDKGARCLVVSLKNSAYNPLHERQVRTWIKEEYPRDYLGSVPVFLASDITNLPGTQERTNTAVINAYIHARLVKFLYKAEDDLRKHFYRRPLLIVHATGGVARVAKTKAINTYNSGPAAGLMGVAALSRLYKVKHLISGDMGGTSFDIGVVRNGQPNFTLRPVIEGLPLSTPMVAINAIGAGGGSIATVKHGELRVGPQSAGALPGPACFSLGGTNATTTDADLVLGYINPNNFLGGKMKLDAAKAVQAIEMKIAAQLKVDVIEAALIIRDKIEAYIGAELRKTIEAMGPDFKPTMVIYGGAGSTHCCGIAFHAGIKNIIAPLYAPVFSANSLSSMDVWHIYSRRLGQWIKKNGGIFADDAAVEQTVKDMYSEAVRDMRGEGFTDDQVTNLIEFFVSRGNNAPEARVVIKGTEWADTFIEAFQQQAPKLFTASDAFSPAMFLHATAKIPHYEVTKFGQDQADPSRALIGSRSVCFGKTTGMTETRIYERLKLHPGNVVQGPAIVEAKDTTYVVREGWNYTVDEYLNGIFEEVAI